MIGTIAPAKIPNTLIGMISQNMFAKKATAVVLDVIAIARDALLNVYAILLLLLSIIFLLIYSLYLQASTNTKTSSAAIPRMT